MAAGCACEPTDIPLPCRHPHIKHTNPVDTDPAYFGLTAGQERAEVAQTSFPNMSAQTRPLHRRRGKDVAEPKRKATSAAELARHQNAKAGKFYFGIDSRYRGGR